MLTPQVKKTYILGLLHDATERKTTFRVATKSKKFADYIKSQINSLGGGAWIYKEGKDRNLWIVEFSKTFLKDVFVKTKLQNYWRFFVSVKSYENFTRIIGSKHPDKKIYLWMKI